MTDMVKKITFQAKNSSGIQISHPVNNMFLLLSENYGLIRTINFKLFPDLYDGVWYNENCHEYELSGIEGNEAGIQNLTKEEIFNMDIGDEFHTEKVSNSWATVYYDRELMLYSIISKAISPGSDTLFYEASRCGKKEKKVDTVVTFFYYNDTVEFVYVLEQYSFIDAIPEKIIVEGNEDFHEYAYNTQGKLENSEKMIKGQWNGFYSMFPHDCIEMIITVLKNPGYENDYYVEGLGGPYWNNVDPYWVHFHKILYYKTATEEWGEPLNCDSLMVNIENPIVGNQKVFFTPNPMMHKSTIKFRNENSGICSLVLFDLYGNKLKQLTTTGKEISLEKGNLRKGMYLYSLMIGNRVVHSGKLIVQ
jgi:hypothetical protein